MRGMAFWSMSSVYVPGTLGISGATHEWSSAFAPALDSRTSFSPTASPLNAPISLATSTARRMRRCLNHGGQPPISSTPRLSISTGSTPTGAHHGPNHAASAVQEIPPSQSDSP